MLILADTNVILRLAAPTDPQHQTVREAVHVIRERGDELVITSQTAAEFWNVCTRPATARGGFGLDVTETDRRLRVIEQLFPVLDDTPTAYQLWRNLVVTLGVTGVQVHDTRLAALMRAHGVTHILTFNGADFARFGFITAIDPTSLVPPPSSSVPPTS